MTSRPRAPGHLSTPARRLFTEVNTAFVLEPHDLAILTKSLEAHDRAAEARRIIDKEGLVIQSRFGEAKAHPAVAIERDSRAAFLAGFRQLHLDYEPVSNVDRTAGARSARWK